MTYLNLSAVRRTPLILDESDAERQAANSDYADVRRSRHLIRFFVDKSGSMYKLRPDVLDAVVRGAETARYRIKKKLGLSADDSMEAFLKKF